MTASNDIGGRLPIEPGRPGGGVSTDHGSPVNKSQTTKSNSSEDKENSDPDTAPQKAIESGLELPTHNAMSTYDSDMFARTLAENPSYNKAEEQKDVADLLPKIKGLFRLLDLYSENGSGGLVDKVIISQESLRKLINCLSPGAYKSMNIIDFESLDDVLLKPLGVYGSKSELVRFLRDINAIDDSVASLLLAPVDVSSHIQPTLRSGIYALIPQNDFTIRSPGGALPFYVLYWPEDCTWDDRDSGKNRVAFMHYLTRVTDQIRSLISLEHEESLVLHDLSVEPAPQRRTAAEDSESSDDDIDSRFHQFEVAKSSEEEEGVKLGSGFCFIHPAVGSTTADSLDPGISLPTIFVSGGTTQAFLSQISYPQRLRKRDVEGIFEPIHLRAALKFHPHILLDGVDEAGLDILMEEGGLKERREVYNRYTQYLGTTRATSDPIKQEVGLSPDNLGIVKQNSPHLRRQVRQLLADHLTAIYPTLDFPSHSAGKEDNDHAGEPSDPAFLASLKTSPELQEIFAKVVNEANFERIPNSEGYIDCKTRLMTIHHLISTKGGLSDHEREELGRGLLSEDIFKPKHVSRKNRWRPSFSFTEVANWARHVVGFEPSHGKNDIETLQHSIKPLNDRDFIRSLNRVVVEDPVYAALASQASETARTALQEEMRQAENELVVKIESVHRKNLEDKASEALREKERQERREAFKIFLNDIREVLAPISSKPSLVINAVREDSTRSGHSRTFRMQAYAVQAAEAEVVAELWSLSFTESDRQRMVEDPGFIPTPRTEKQPTFTFSLPPFFKIRHIQVIGSNTCMLLAEGQGGLRLWLTPMLKELDWTRPTRSFPLTGEYTIAVDEQQRRLAFVTFNSEKSHLAIHLYVFDDDYSNVHGSGSPATLNRWYPEGVPTLASACFFSGTEDLCLVETSGRIRVFSFLSQCFRPRHVQLESSPISVQSSPDGSAIVVVREVEDHRRVVNVFHQASWGVNASGIVERLPESFSATTEHCVSSITVGTRTVLMGLDLSARTIHALSLEISRKETEYQFRAEKEIKQPVANIKTEHNSLIDCFSQVWGRYPVVSAIQREVFTFEGRAPPSVTFVTSRDHPFEAYFQRMIRTFNKATKKPTGKRLVNLSIRTSKDIFPSDVHERSTFKAGEWIIELICLIPLHIAVARENRFIPLKDGVFDKKLERDLLGAEIPAIIDSISLGWYESILSSYMVTKPVKVVSSMGEQSVGKSYSLNHFVDSSFSGSAVRTTEGVWLSICPTKDLLVVALDFEGVHSIERTAQEDMLLVLFNTALSNLILFRNNYALSRDVAHLFTSFQSSTQMFDPATNPKLFRGVLAIVIKDVVDRDTHGIVQEFRSKFSQIVSKEQKTNFITVLHNSKLTIIPWSVIESKQFYSLFNGLSQRLLGQPPTYTSAGDFLLTLKTLMAKLKAQDWGSIDSTVIKHRVAFLSSRLGNALCYGQLDIEPSVEPLRSLNTRQLITCQPKDTRAVFSLDKSPNKVAAVILRLLNEWKPDAARNSVPELTQHLNAIVQARVSHVATWLQENLAQFPADNADIRGLRRSFDEQAEFLQSSVQLCLSECSECHLRCMLNKSHDQLSEHDCHTSHRCDKECTYGEQHEAEVKCGLRAGHDGRHICDPSLHLCGDPCRLSDKRGCQRSCTKPSDHTDDVHECAARTHQCGLPCALQSVKTSSGTYLCAGFCTFPHDVKHEDHSCENRLSCPVRCALCPQYCTMGDHFHGKDANAVHLCGKEHPCSYECECPGICEINTTPNSVETTYTGRFTTFQYTKYTQVAKRNPCAKKIPPRALTHDGGHVHSEEQDVFHYCEARCENCNYFCHLPLGHPQREHETAHGSMENTRWAIEGNEDATIEIEGRKFGNRDNGAPMLCSTYCKQLGRHTHIAYCNSRSAGLCRKPESEHITVKMLPHPARAKDWVSHKQFWAQTGFRDPYSRDEQEDFGRCDHRCAGPEHDATATEPANPSYCTLPIFHPPQPLDFHAGGHDSHVSIDGHSFACPDPNTMRRSFHVIFVLDRSTSMLDSDRRPLPDQPVSRMIANRANNRFGAVLSALFAFWTSRVAGTTEARRDAYSIISFDHAAKVVVEDDFTSRPEQLLGPLLNDTAPFGGTSFDAGLQAAQEVMEIYWSTERSPVIIFLSDGECGVTEDVMFDLCNSSVARGSPLSFHSVSFGRNSQTTSLRRMASVAEQVARNVPANPRNPVVPSSYASALDSIELAETFLDIAASLQKTRGSLIRF